MFCDNCGSKLEDDAKFCRSCGKQIAPSEASEIPVVQNPLLVFKESKNWMARLHEGRIGRKYWILGVIFWYVTLMVILVSGVLSLNPSGNGISDSFTWLFVIACVIFFFFVVSLTIRRLHDLNHADWKVLLFLIPVINLFMLAWLLSAKGTNGQNQYGNQPSKERKFLKSILNSTDTANSSTQNN